jgi:hypothetical protein
LWIWGRKAAAAVAVVALGTPEEVAANPASLTENTCPQFCVTEVASGILSEAPPGYNPANENACTFLFTIISIAPSGLDRNCRSQSKNLESLRKERVSFEKTSDAVDRTKIPSRSLIF